MRFGLLVPEVWGGEGGGRNMNEFTPVLYFYPFIPKFSHQCSSSLHADTSSRTFPLRARQWVCVCAEPDGRPTLARGSFLWPGQCVSRRLAGVSGASSSFQLHSLTPGPLQRAFATQPLLSHFEILQHTNSTWFPAFIKSDRLRLWDLLRRRRWGGGEGGWGGGESSIQKLERTLRAGFTAQLAMGSLGLRCNDIAPKMSRLKCLPVCLPSCWRPCSLSLTCNPGGCHRDPQYRLFWDTSWLLRE